MPQCQDGAGGWWVWETTTEAGDIIQLVTETAKPEHEEQQRKESDLLNTLERLIQDVRTGRLFGEFGVHFTAQAGRIGHYTEERRITRK